MIRSLFLVCLLHCLAMTLRAEEAALPPAVELVIDGQRIDEPAFKYRLFPAESELREGNAAPILLRLPWEQGAWMNKVAPTLHEWVDKPLSSPDWERFGMETTFGDRFYGELKRAAYRREAHWEYPIQETTPPHGILLPDAQGMRVFLGHGLPARIRYHLSRGELDQAREGILVGHANARHMARTPFYIMQLIAASHHQVMLNQTTEMIAQPKCPNMYWALTTLPQSLVELERAARFEADMFSMTFPAVHDFDSPRTPDEWRKMGRQLVEFLVEFQELEVPKIGGELALEVAIRQVIDKHARAELTTRQGFTAEQVAAMSDEEAGVRWYTHRRISIDQKGAAICSLSPREAWSAARQWHQEVEDFRSKTSVQHYQHFSPVSISLSVWSLQRKIASLRIVEAIRHYVALHEGRLPVSLDEIDGVTIPHDPLTDLPFIWMLDGEVGSLQAPALPEDIVQIAKDASQSSVIDYRVRVRKAE